MFMHHHFFFGRHFLGGPLIVLLLGLALVAAVALAVVLFTRDRHVARPVGPASSEWQQASEAARILDERFARGEIDDEEYQRRKRLLSTGASSSG
jgi:putative membrane protein